MTDIVCKNGQIVSGDKVIMNVGNSDRYSRVINVERNNQSEDWPIIFGVRIFTMFIYVALDKNLAPHFRKSPIGIKNLTKCTNAVFKQIQKL
jgi:hypothetical protein